MKDANTQSGEKRRTRRLSFAAAGMFAVALCVFGGLFYLQSRAANNNKPTRGAWMRPDISEARKQEIIARASYFRDKWRPWAFAHRAELQRMLNAPRGDPKALDTMWNLLPARPSEAGIKWEELMPSGTPLRGVGFGWGTSGRNARRNPKLSREVEAQMEKADRGLAELRKDDFKELNDIPMFGTSQGRTRIHLWASGRITKQALRTLEEQHEALTKVEAEGRQWRQSDFLWPHQEVVPPYDFLTLPNQPASQVRRQKP